MYSCFKEIDNLLGDTEKSHHITKHNDKSYSRTILNLYCLWVLKYRKKFPKNTWVKICLQIYYAYVNSGWLRTDKLRI